MDAEHLSVLLVEDDEDDVLLMEDMLEQGAAGLFRVVREDRLSDGIERARSESLDAVLLDLTLPDSSGLETFQQFRNTLPELPIVVLTGLRDEELAVLAVQDGV